MYNSSDKDTILLKLNSKKIVATYDTTQLSEIPFDQNPQNPIGINLIIDSYQYYTILSEVPENIIGYKILSEYMWINIPLMLKTNSAYFNSYLKLRLMELLRSELKSSKSYNISDLQSFVSKCEEQKIGIDKWTNYRLNESYVYSFKKNCIKPSPQLPLFQFHRCGGIIETDHIKSIIDHFDSDTLYVCSTDLWNTFSNLPHIIETRDLEHRTIKDLEKSFLHRKRVVVINCCENAIHYLKIVIGFFNTPIVWLVYTLPIKYFFNSVKESEDCIQPSLGLNNLLSISNIWLALENGQKKEYRRELARFLLCDLSKYFGIYTLTDPDYVSIDDFDLTDSDEKDLWLFIKKQSDNLVFTHKSLTKFKRNLSSLFFLLMMSYRQPHTVRESLNKRIVDKISLIENDRKEYIQMIEQEYDPTSGEQIGSQMLALLHDLEDKYRSIKKDNVFASNECCICYEQMNIQSMLLCGHSMCPKCLIISSVKKQFNCPNCRAHCKIEDTVLLRDTECPTFSSRMRDLIGQNYFMTDLPPFYFINPHLIHSFKSLITHRDLHHMRKIFMLFGKKRKKMSQIISHIKLINPLCEIILIDCNLL